MVVHGGGVRRTQAERRSTSRRRLVDAATECLAELGYAGTTIPEVLRRAGLSNGAMWRYFPTKLDLLAAVTETLDLLPDAEARAALTGLSDQDRVDAAVDQMWRLAASARFQAIIELVRASRADEQLRDVLIASDQSAATAFFESLRALLGADIAASPDFERNARVLGLSFYGVAVTHDLRHGDAPRRLRDELVEVARELFLS
jgi:AcrR family transcriptional regulator